MGQVPVSPTTRTMTGTEVWEANQQMQTYPETQENLLALLEQAREEGEVRIRRTDGQIFVLKPEKNKCSALGVTGIDLGISTKEIVEFVREGRERL
jgi:hypothetical protein